MVRRTPAPSRVPFGGRWPPLTVLALRRGRLLSVTHGLSCYRFRFAGWVPLRSRDAAALGVVPERCNVIRRPNRLVAGFVFVHEPGDNLKPATSGRVQLRVDQALDLLQRGSMIHSRSDRSDVDVLATISERASHSRSDEDSKLPTLSTSWRLSDNDLDVIPERQQ